MNCMFNNATSFNQNISNWNVSNSTDVNSMFYNTSISFYKLKTTSFFDAKYKNMLSLKRKKLYYVFNKF